MNLDEVERLSALLKEKDAEIKKLRAIIEDNIELLEWVCYEKGYGGEIKHQIDENRAALSKQEDSR